MSPAEYDIFLEKEILGYAEDKVKSGNWSADVAVQRSRDDFAKLLTQGVETPGQHLFTIRGTETGQNVGAVWLAVVARDGQQMGFIYDLVVDEAHRRKGHARAAMLAIEDKARELDLEVVGLHVFGFNTAARELYESLGYEITNINMAKKL